MIFMEPLIVFAKKHTREIAIGASLLANAGGLALSIKAAERIVEKKYDPEMTMKKYWKENWVHYTPSIFSVISGGALTFAIYKNCTGAISGLTSALASSNNIYTNYVNAVKSIDPQVHQRSMDQLIKSGDVLIFDMESGAQFTFGIEEEQRQFYDMYSQRYFESTVQQVMQAEYEVNKKLALDEDVTAADFYDYLGLPFDEKYTLVGFRSDELMTWIDFDNQTRYIDDLSMEVLVIDMPIYWRNL